MYIYAQNRYSEINYTHTCVYVSICFNPNSDTLQTQLYTYIYSMQLLVFSIIYAYAYILYINVILYTYVLCFNFENMKFNGLFNSTPYEYDTIIHKSLCQTCTIYQIAAIGHGIGRLIRHQPVASYVLIYGPIRLKIRLNG